MLTWQNAIRQSQLYAHLPFHIGGRLIRAKYGYRAYVSRIDADIVTDMDAAVITHKRTPDGNFLADASEHFLQDIMSPFPVLIRHRG